MKKIFTFLFILVSFFTFADTNIDSTCKYAWSGSAGWINFGCQECNVQVLDDKITGYAWSQNYGWINLHPTSTNVGIFNDSQGNLSGYAWGENLGWIDFSNVKIDTNTGNFSGYALILIYSSSSDEMKKIVFQGDNFCLKTSWRPSSGGGSIGGSYGYYSVGSSGYYPDHGEEISSNFDQNILKYILNLIVSNLPKKLDQHTQEKKIAKKIKPVEISSRKEIYIFEEKTQIPFEETSTDLEKVVKEKIGFPFTGGLKITYTLKDLDLTLFNANKISQRDELISKYFEFSKIDDENINKLINNLNLQIIILLVLSIIILYVVFIFL